VNIESWFPTLIGQEILPNHNEIAKKIVPVCKKIQKKTPNIENDWISKLYQTCHTHNICDDPKFKLINNIIYEKVYEYLTKLNSTQKIIFKEGWFNVYKQHDFQEFHCHPSRDISVIYVLKSNTSSPRIGFQQDRGLYNIENDVQTRLLSPNCYFNSVQGNLLIFRSSLHHCVEMKKDKEERISLAYNFRINPNQVD